MKAIVIHSQDGDWEGLFIDDELIAEGHQLGDGKFREFWLNIAHEYKVTADSLSSVELDDEDDRILSEVGSLPERLSHMDGDYK